MGVARGIAVARSPRRRRRRDGREIGSAIGLGAEIVGHAAGAGFAGGMFEPVVEFVREFLKGALLDRVECRRRRRLRCGGRARAVEMPVTLGGGSSAARRGRLRCGARWSRGGRGRGRCRNRDSRRTGGRGRTPAGRTFRSAGARLRRRSASDDDAAPGVARGERARHVALRVELERGGDLGPGAVEQGGGFGPEQAGEFSAPSVKRVAASICQTKRNVNRRGALARRPGRAGGRRAGGCGAAAPRAGFGRSADCWRTRQRRAAASRSAPAPSRSSVTGPAAMSPSASPLSLASRASFSAPSAIRSRPLPKRSRAGGVASINSPSAVNIAAGRSKSAEQPVRAFGQAQILAGAFGRDHQNGGLLSASAMREHRQISVPPKLAPKPRSRSSRGAPPCGSVPARRAICAAAGWLGSKRMAASARRRGGVEDRGRGRIGPEDARRVRAPQPYRRRTQGVRREPRIAQTGRIGTRSHSSHLAHTELRLINP